MKKLLSLVCVMAFGLTHATTYTFNVELSSYTVAPTFAVSGSVLVYSGSIPAEASFFSGYVITGFYQTYPDSRLTANLNYFTFETTSSTLMANIVSTFPTKYIRTENLTGISTQLLYYPNDYGTTHTPNLGAPISLKSYDYINVPKAWDYTLGSVTVGISDGKILSTDADFSAKTTYFNLSEFDPTFTFGSASSHGTSIGAIAAAQGNNSYGTTGICPSCPIFNIPFTRSYDGLLTLAYNGAKVINMSWIDTRTTDYFDPLNPSGSGYIQSRQNVINEIHDLGVVLVAGAGNENIYKEDPPGTPVYGPDFNLYYFPCSYNHVISVSGVNHKNANFSDEVITIAAPYNQASVFNQDLVGPSGAYNYNGQTYTPFYSALTVNTQVDVCAPAYEVALYGRYLLGYSPIYASATSPATPYVTGTAALMVSLNGCLTPNEVEDVIQLTSKNLESNPYNYIWVGRSGSGKLETGDAVEFVYEMMDSSGEAVIDGQDFYRFSFDLPRINNRLKIENQIFRDANISSFTARTAIEVFPGSDFKPNSSGSVLLEIDGELELCPNESRIAPAPIVKGPSPVLATKANIYPNPNAGKFSVKFNADVRDVNVEIHDIFGKTVYKSFSAVGDFDIDVPGLATGVYFLTLTTNDYKENIKFIKQ